MYGYFLKKMGVKYPALTAFLLLCGLFIFEGQLDAFETKTLPLSLSSQSDFGTAKEALKSNSSSQVPTGQFEVVPAQGTEDAGAANEKFPKALLGETASNPAKMLSEIEKQMPGSVPSIAAPSILQFGYSLFEKPPPAFAPINSAPVGPNYVLGPGDELRISVWGNIEGIWSVTIDRDGNISLPKIGVLGVSGLSFEEIKETLEREFSKYYTGFHMNISMGSLRTITVYAVGNAMRPGAYTISSSSTLLNALFEAGGPSKTGTMRDIRLKRNGEEIARFDVYDLLLKGVKSKDVRLMPEDVIFIPPIGHIAGISGNVRNPAIYELNGGERLLDLIEMAGGLTSVAFMGRVQVWRVKEGMVRTIFEEDLIGIEKGSEKNFELKDGDLVQIFAVSDAATVVKLRGAVASEGEFAIEPGKTKISDVIAKSGGTLYYSSEEAEITRVKITQDGPKTERLIINIRLATEGNIENNVTLEPNDYIFIRNIPEWQLYQAVSIGGEVRYPGTYTIKKGERLSSLIERADGFTDEAYLKGAVFIRQRVKDLQQGQLDEMVSRLEMELMREGSQDVGMAASAEVMKTKEAEIVQKREFISKLKTLKATGRLVISVDRPELLKNTAYDIALEEGDSIFIPSNPGSVQVMGLVYNQSAFVYDGNKNLSDYVDMAGGYMANADKKKTYILRADGTAMRPKGGISWNGVSHRWERGQNALQPGDAIVVPEEIDKIAWLREIKDMTQILYQIAVTAGVLIVVF